MECCFYTFSQDISVYNSFQLNNNIGLQLNSRLQQKIWFEDEEQHSQIFDSNHTQKLFWSWKTSSEFSVSSNRTLTTVDALSNKTPNTPIRSLVIPEPAPVAAFLATNFNPVETQEISLLQGRHVCYPRFRTWFRHMIGSPETDAQAENAR